MTPVTAGAEAWGRRPGAWLWVVGGGVPKDVAQGGGSLDGVELSVADWRKVNLVVEEGMARRAGVGRGEEAQAASVGASTE